MYWTHYQEGGPEYYEKEYLKGLSIQARGESSLLFTVH